jgi:uncharacterized delta-60 repeat protein
MKKRKTPGAVVLFLLAACNTPTPPSFNPSLGSSTLEMRQMASSTLPVNFGRSNFTAPLTARVTGTSGSLVSVADVTSSSESATLEFVPVAGTPLNAGQNVVVEVSDGSTTKQLPLTVRVLPAQPNTLVNGFGLGGVHLNTNLSAYRGVVVQSDDKIVLLSQNKLFRLNQNGSSDTAFGASGVVNLPAGLNAYRLLLQDDGKILVIGVQSNQLKLFRLNPDGSPDAGYTSGLVSIALGNIVNVGAVRFSDDRSQIYVGVNTTQGVVLVRYLASGALDTAFAPDGNSPGRAHLAGANGVLYRVNALLPRANVIYVGGSASNATGSDALLVALDANGTLPAGKTRVFDFVSPGGNPLPRSSISQLLTSGSNVRVVGGGQTSTANAEYNHIASAEFSNTTNLPATTFSSDGFEAVALGFNATVDKVLRDAGGKYLVLGGIQASLALTSSSTLATFYAARLNADGTLDGTYGTNGIGRVATLNESNPFLEAAREDNSGNIVVVGGAGSVGMAFKFVP